MIDRIFSEPFFPRLYVSFNAMKTGFKDGCRPLIYLDGCFLKGGFKGQLLSAVARDPNNNMYLVAFVVVEAELKDNWELFLETLVGDLGSAPPRGWTFMSDRQKGLAQDFKAVIPMVDHRFCVKHLYANFRDADHRGVALKDKLWCAATAYTESESNKKMDELKALSPNAHEYLRKVDYT